MFECDVVEWGAAETLAGAERAKTRVNEAEVDRLILAAHFADLYPSAAMIPGGQTVPGRERCLIYGGPGCPGVAEFAVAEYAVVMGVSTQTAAKDIGQVLCLRHRLPAIWAAVMARTATVWKARLIATECLGLSIQAAAIVDRRVAGIVDTLTPYRLRTIVKAAIWQADPDTARAEAERKARERGVSIGQSDDHGTTTLFIKAATGDVIRLYATITQLADALAALGDTDNLDQRRAKAIGILSDPALADKLLHLAQYLATHPNAATDTSTADNASDSADAPDTADTDTAAAAAATDPATSADTSSDAAADNGDHTKPTDHHAPTDRPAQANTSAATSRPRAEHSEPSDQTAQSAQATEAGYRPDDTEPEVTRDGEPASDLFPADEPSLDTDADADADAEGDAPRSGLPGYLLDPPPFPPEPPESAESPESPGIKELADGIGAAGRHNLATKLAAIKHAADTGTGISGRRPGRTKLYVHVTDETLLAGGGVARVEGFGPVFAAKLAELLGHDRIVVQPVIDLNNDHVNVNAYEIPDRIRERIKLTYPVEQFPYGPGETTNSTDLDHITPFDPDGPPGQTSSDNLQPLGRPSHRIKTHAPGWTVHRIDTHTTEWTTPHGYTFHVDHTGTHPVTGTHPWP